ncbi:hypothetical protein [Legionella quinlivanii]|uniref:hypothetical protein n=1 Tax=Legionella quinlivanii TaxID=45073 RepID=UPI0022447F8D|nr:hypothetical protein [Legionella quinlivanii]MCW8451348.1 hypothetical protein [Legionella quinlivanii]
MTGLTREFKTKAEQLLLILKEAVNENYLILLSSNPAPALGFSGEELLYIKSFRRFFDSLPENLRSLLAARKTEQFDTAEKLYYLGLDNWEPAGWARAYFFNPGISIMRSCVQRIDKYNEEHIGENWLNYHVKKIDTLSERRGILNKQLKDKNLQEEMKEDLTKQLQLTEETLNYHHLQLQAKERQVNALLDPMYSSSYKALLSLIDKCNLGTLSVVQARISKRPAEQNEWQTKRNELIELRRSELKAQWSMSSLVNQAGNSPVFSNPAAPAALKPDEIVRPLNDISLSSPV